MQPESSQPSTPTSTPPARRSKKRMLIILVIVLIAAAIAATFYMWQAASDREALESAVAEVSITENGFVPETILIASGQSITWINENGKVHQLAADQPELENLSIDELAPGESFNFTFEESGTFTYHDPLNPETHKGTIVVE